MRRSVDIHSAWERQGNEYSASPTPGRLTASSTAWDGWGRNTSQRRTDAGKTGVLTDLVCHANLEHVGLYIAAIVIENEFRCVDAADPRTQSSALGLPTFQVGSARRQLTQE